MPTAPDSQQHHTITAAIAVRGAAQALEFYRRAFEAREILRVPGPDSTIAHAQMRIGDSLFFLAEENRDLPNGYQSPQTLRGTSFAFYVYVPDAEATFRRAVDAGAEPLAEVTQQSWGDREGLVRDPFGHLWALATRA